MADNFNLRAFLTENKLTKNAKLIQESTVLNRKLVDTSSIELGGKYPSDIYIESAKFEDGTPLSEEELRQLEKENPDLAAEIGFERQTDGFDEGKKETWEEGIEEEENQTPKHKIVAQWMGPDFFLAKKKESEWDQKDHDLYNRLNKMVQTTGQVPNVSEESSNSPKETYTFERRNFVIKKNEHISHKPVTYTYEEVGGDPDNYIGGAAATVDKCKEEIKGKVLDQKEASIKESKLTARERRLVEMAQDAVETGEEGGYGDEYVRRKLRKRGQEPGEAATYTEADEMVKEEPLPEYKTIQELMKQIDDNASKATYEYRIAEMKRIVKQLEEKATTLEESEHANHINPADIKKLKAEALTVRKAVAKEEKIYDRKFNKKKKEAPKKEEPVTLAENKKRNLLKSRILSENRLSLEKRNTNTNTNTNTMENFDLKKFLVENKLTTNSKILKENVVTLLTNDDWEYDFAEFEDTPQGVKIYYPNPDTEEMEYKYTVPGTVDSLLAKLESLGAVEDDGDGSYYAIDEEAIVDALESM